MSFWVRDLLRSLSVPLFLLFLTSRNVTGCVIAGAGANRVMSVIDINANLSEGAITFRIRRSIGYGVLGSQIATDLFKRCGKFLQPAREKSVSTCLPRKHF